MSKPPSILRLRELLTYDPDSGVWRWRVARGRSYRAGALAGGSPTSRRYVQIRLDGVLYRAHKLAWLYMRGEWPRDDELIVPKDSDWKNLRYSNLRKVDFVSYTRPTNWAAHPWHSSERVAAKRRGLGVHLVVKG